MGTRKDHFPLPFVDQMLEKVTGHEFYCFLDGYSFRRFSSRLVPATTSEGLPIGDTFPDQQLFALFHFPWYEDIINYLVTGHIPPQWTSQQKRKFFVDIKKYYFDDPYLFKYCLDKLMRRCVSNDDQIGVLTFYHSEACGGHFSARKTTNKIRQVGFYWPTLFKDCFVFCKTCVRCQQLGGVTKRNMMPLTPILIIEIFNMLIPRSVDY